MTDRIEVVAALIRRGDRFLFQQRAAFRDYPHSWECPGGKVEAGEAPLQALWRELREEIDWDSTLSPGTIEPNPFFQTVFMPPEMKKLVRVSFYHALPKDEWRPQLIDGNGLGWFTIQEMGQLHLAPGNQRLLSHLHRTGWNSTMFMHLAMEAWDARDDTASEGPALREEFAKLVQERVSQVGLEGFLRSTRRVPHEERDLNHGSAVSHPHEGLSGSPNSLHDPDKGEG